VTFVLSHSSSLLREGFIKLRLSQGRADSLQTMPFFLIQDALSEKEGAFIVFVFFGD